MIDSRIHVRFVDLRYYANIIVLLARGQYKMADAVLITQFPISRDSYLFAHLRSRIFRALEQSEKADELEVTSREDREQRQSVARRARQLANEAADSGDSRLALRYSLIAQCNDPYDMRIHLNRSAHLWRLNKLPQCYRCASDALCVGLVFGAPAHLIAEARQRLTAIRRECGSGGAEAFATNQPTPGDQFAWSSQYPAPQIADEWAHPPRYLDELWVANYAAAMRMYGVARMRTAAAIRLRPTAVEPHMCRAVIGLLSGIYGAGVAETRRIIALRGCSLENKARAIWIGSMCLFGQDQVAEGRRGFTRATLLHPANQLYEECLARLTDSADHESIKWFNGMRLLGANYLIR